MNRNLKYAFVAALMVAVGMLAGFQLKDTTPQEKREQLSSGFQKIQEAIWFVERNYVDEPKTQKMVDDAIEGILEGLDPHSFYIPAKEMEQMEEQMQGSFEGIGIEFNLLEDTLYVVAALTGGPSEEVGIHAGDRIVTIDGEDVAGVGLTNTDVMKKLRGPKGSEVKVEVVRRGHAGKIPFEIERDKIPIYSLDYSYMISEDVGYIKISRFASTTHDEFRKAAKKLKTQGMEGMILDLRGNPGGYMQMAEKIADEFLSEGKLVVYTDGRTYDSKSRYKATSYLDLFEDGPLIILLDYGSASASEIVAGAVQDWDRGLILGVRSFGKGLVQTQKEFSDGSAMRLVISQYYTPSGRCIQKPFHMSSKEYEQELIDRFESGEVYDESKVDLPDSLKFKTNAGRSVYGGGGIMPDVFVPRDTTRDSDYLADLIAHNTFRQYSFYFADLNKDFESRYPDAASFRKNFKVTQEVMDEFTAFATEKGAPVQEEGLKQSEEHIKLYVKSFIGRRFYNDDGFYPVYHKTDNVLNRALELIPEAKELKKKGKFSLRN